MTHIQDVTAVSTSIIYAPVENREFPLKKSECDFINVPVVLLNATKHQQDARRHRETHTLSACSISRCEAAYRWAITTMDTCSAESHTERRGSHLHTNQAGLPNVRRGGKGTAEKETLQAWLGK